MSDSSKLDILVPNLPESVIDATVSVWHKKEGDKIKQGEILLEIETDKIMLEVPALQSGILLEILEKSGSIVIAGQILGRLECNNFSNQIKPLNFSDNQNSIKSTIAKKIEDNLVIQEEDKHSPISPVIRKLITKYNLNIDNIKGSGIKGRLTRQDIETYIQKNTLSQTYNVAINTDFKQSIYDNAQQKNDFTHDNRVNTIRNDVNNRTDTRVIMSRLRKKISERLLKVTNSTAILTTFNEVNMQCIINIRNKYQESFEKNHNIKLGFMSFFVKAVVEGLRRFPEINAYIDGEEIIYHNYFDISIAVSTPRGLVTPVLRNADKLRFVDIEKNIKLLANKGKTGKLTLDDLNGGNFTITNGGIFGSLLSTPIINPPQSAILGMHAIKDRPMALNGNIVILPMMYLALSYDHRLIDGKDSVNFLITVKNLIEDPMSLLLEN
ncbi:dihydrolipoamide succinyltransferase component (E2) [Candidatus Blochmanniella floridana]|uniref:Dihydrolipoyllysine-residue succinyltransferase component of 2-oxoglutarate dehydrogenase complex n=1 Tax=Blochmanniella floridana TaxID=203907 RepID=Q7VR90_BLOFL|nr:dihydrolipoamide succinyltransferase component (E2) [Candidatus Blochmannia floridanus]